MNDFVIENGVLIKYRGTQKNVVIPNSVTSIGNEAFSYCPNLQSISIPDSVTSIGSEAFSGCKNLRKVELPDSIQSIPLMFGDNFPIGLVYKIPLWYPKMTDSVLKKYVLIKKVWNTLDPDMQVEIFISKQSKTLTKTFIPLITQTQAKRISEYYLTSAASALSANKCKSIASFIANFYTKLSDQAIHALYEALLAQKNGKKAAAELEKDTLLASKLNAVAKTKKSLT